MNNRMPGSLKEAARSVASPVSRVGSDRLPYGLTSSTLPGCEPLR